ncbi:MAG: DUF2029 domain-containing protein [Clostridiales bacterium]|nr:DUF2029 domain-containing protein [Clostridiales bacterium]
MMKRALGIPAFTAAALLVSISSVCDVFAADSNNEVVGAGNALASGYNNIMLVYLALYAIILSILFLGLGKKSGTSLGKALDGVAAKENLALVAGLGFALLVRLFSCTIITGWPNDIVANKSWALSAGKNLLNFYNAGWCDYPPFFIYVLMIIGRLMAAPSLSAYSTLLIKLPSMLADMVSAYMIYQFALSGLGLKKNGRLAALSACFAYAVHPMVFLDSTIWGQVDSFFTMIILAALVLLIKKNVTFAAVLFSVAVLMKPQGIFFLPVLLFELIKLRSVRNFLKAAAGGFITAFIIVFPFAVKMGPLWIFELYLGTASEYTATAMNAFNFFTLAGANFVDGSTIPLLFSYTTWGLIFTLIVVLLAAYLHIKSKSSFAPIFSAILLNSGAFIFSTKMHERYMYPVIALSLLLSVLTMDKRIFLLFSGFSITVFANVHVLFVRMLATDVPSAHLMGDAIYPVIAAFSILNIALFAYLVKVYAETCGKEISKPLSGKRNSIIVIAVISASTAFLSPQLSANVYAEGVGTAGNLLSNPSFELSAEASGSIMIPEGWAENQYVVNPDSAEGSGGSGAAAVTEVTVSDKSKEGLKSMQIKNISENDARLQQTIKAEGDSTYRLSGWIMAENAGSAGKGANLSITDQVITSEDFKDTSGSWEYTEIYVSTGSEAQTLTISAGLGGYGSMNTGTAWFDDLAFVKVDAIPAGAIVINTASTTASGNGSSSGEAESPAERDHSKTPKFIFALASLAAISLAVYYSYRLEASRNATK